MDQSELPEKIKLIWDFRGTESYRIAEHHEIHLKDFIKREKTQFNITGTEKVSEMHTLVFMVIAREEMDSLRQKLKPVRAQAYLN